METIDTGRHPVNIGHLVMGLAFLGLVAVWSLIEGGAVADGDIRWLLPVPWVIAGVAGLVATALTARRHATTQTGWVGDEPTVAPAAEEPWEEPTDQPDDEPDDTAILPEDRS